jgi:integrase
LAAADQSSSPRKASRVGPKTGRQLRQTAVDWWTRIVAPWSEEFSTLRRLEPHDLRATAITLMRDAGFTKEQAAARVGHADSGQLIDRIYDRGDRRARAGVRAIDSLAPKGIRAALFEPPPRPSDRSAAAGLEAFEER